MVQMGWMSLGAPEEWGNITMWLLHGSFQGHDQIYGASALGGPVPVLECQKGDWKQPSWSCQQHIVHDEIDCPP